MWLTPASTACRSTASACSRSRGGPNTPRPGSCIAPNPIRRTGRPASRTVVSLICALIHCYTLAAAATAKRGGERADLGDKDDAERDDEPDGGTAVYSLAVGGGDDNHVDHHAEGGPQSQAGLLGQPAVVARGAEVDRHLRSRRQGERTVDGDPDDGEQHHPADDQDCRAHADSLTSSGTRTWASGLPQPVTGSQPG